MSRFTLLPEFSNLITTGGLIAPERFQFLVWTILGVFAYLFVVLWQSPEQIKDLPQIPSGFLQLMGISSAGYLGGKLARKPGPFINSIESSIDNENSLVLNIQGSNLSSTATFKLNNGDQIPSSLIKSTIKTSEENASDSSLAKVLEIVIKNPKKAWYENGNILTIYNSDTQYSEQKFEAPKDLNTSNEQKNISTPITSSNDIEAKILPEDNKLDETI